MKIEQIERNKIKIILSKEDLDNNKISLHSLMSNSIETQNFFIKALDLAEKEIGFITSNYDVTIETLTLNDSDFILTITRLESTKQTEHKLIVNRKTYTSSNCFKFENFDFFYSFFKIVKFSSDFIKSLYFFNNSFYYVPNQQEDSILKFELLSEFAIPANISENIIKNLGILVY